MGEQMQSMGQEIIQLRAQQSAAADAAAAQAASTALAQLAAGQQSQALPPQSPHAALQYQRAAQQQAERQQPAPQLLPRPPGLSPGLPARPVEPAVIQPLPHQWSDVNSTIRSIAQDPSAPPADQLAAQRYLMEEEHRRQELEMGLSGANEGRWSALAAVVDPASAAEAANAAVFAGTFAGHQLGVEYAGSKFNPFKRDEQYHEMTCHYHATIVGDPATGAVIEQLLARGCTAGSYEMRSLIPALSYMHDLLFALKSKSTDALSLSDAGDHEAAAIVAMDATIACAKQADAIIQHMMERLAVLRRLAQGNDEELALYNGMYNKEHTRAGQLGRTEALVEASVSSGVTRNLIAASARAVAQRSLPPARTRQQNQTAQQAGGAPPISGRLADAIGRHNNRQSGRGGARGGGQQQQQQQQQQGSSRQHQQQQQQQQQQQPQQQQQQRTQQTSKGAGRGPGGRGGGRGGRGGGAGSSGAEPSPAASE